MAQQTINVGSAANDATGDGIRTALGKVNANFDELYAGQALRLRFLTGNASWDPGSVNSGAVASTTVTVTGAAIGNTAIASFTVALPAGVMMLAAVTAANTVTVTLLNQSGTAVNLDTGTLRVDVFRV